MIFYCLKILKKFSVKPLCNLFFFSIFFHFCFKVRLGLHVSLSGPDELLDPQLLLLSLSKEVSRLNKTLTSF